jgi:ubiquinone/menaquinone biosynthesis C-methylase UbiE
MTAANPTVDSSAPGILNRVLNDGVSLRTGKSGLPPDVEGAAYDTRAAAYDRVVGSALYNRLLWGLPVSRYHSFVNQALNDNPGPLLDAGAGSAVFTADAYVQADRPLLLVDRSRDMLNAARDRLSNRAGGSVPDHVTLLQADLNTLPLRPNSVDTILSMGMLHLFADPVAHVRTLLDGLAPGGSLFATSLVAERTIGRLYLRLLHRAGEVASPRTYDALHEQLSTGLDAHVDGTRTGSMAFLTISSS